MKSLEEIRQATWLDVGNCKVRLDERDWQRLVAALDAGGWVMVPREPTAAMDAAGVSAMCAPMVTSTQVYRAMIEARPK